jgi:hypothetical protein
VAASAFGVVGGFVLAESPAVSILTFAHGDEGLDFRVAANVGIVDDSAEVGFEAGSSLFDEEGTAVGFGPEMGDREGRQFELSLLKPYVEGIQPFMNIFELIVAETSRVGFVVEQIFKAELVVGSAMLH